jgi:hypothetical protein
MRGSGHEGPRSCFEGDCREMIYGRKRRRRRLAGVKRHFREGFSASLRHYCVRLAPSMHESSVRGILIYCADYHCSHSIAISGDQSPDDVRLSDIEHDGQEHDDDGEQHGGFEDFVGHQISNLLLADHAATGDLF